jgi:hypothetical protein
VSTIHMHQTATPEQRAGCFAWGLPPYATSSKRASHAVWPMAALGQPKVLDDCLVTAMSISKED